MTAPVSPAARLFASAGAFGAGVMLAEKVRPALLLLLVVGALALLGMGIRRTVGAVLVAAFALGFALAGLRLSSIEESALARGARRGADALLEGEALSDLTVLNDAGRFLLGARRAEIDGVPLAVRERAWVTIRPPPRDPLRSGTLVRLDTRLRPVFFAKLDAQGRAAAHRLIRRGVAARAFVRPDGLERIGTVANPIARIASAGRAGVRRAAEHLPERERGLLLGIVVGDVSLLDPEVELDFKATGLTHLVAVSGANVAMALALVTALLRLLRAGRRTTVAVLAFSVLCFMAVTRFEPSVLRAGTMAGIALGGVAVGARREAVTALAAATVLLLVYDPFLIFSIGFQLSVLATTGILILTPRLAAHLPPGPFGTAAAVTLGAQLAVAPLIVLFFRQLSLIALAANLIVAPMVAPATTIGMVAALLGLAWAPLSALAVAAGPPLAWMRWMAHALAQLPLASVATPGGALGLLLVAALTALALAAARGARPARAAPILLSLALLTTAGVWARAAGPAPLGGLIVTMLDVGQGDAFLVRSNDRTMLIDGGPDGRTLLRALRAERVARIDLLVLTHPHEDHVAGLAVAAQRLPVARVLDPFIEADLLTYQRFLTTIARRDIPRDRARAGMTYRLGAAAVDVLWPRSEHLQGTEEDVNNNSIVLRVRYGSQAVLFAGETQEEAQQELLARESALRADVLKVSHHGSARMLPSFYAATRARVALIPVGTNQFGHPALTTLAALRGMRVLRTDRSGTVSVSLNGHGALTTQEQRTAA